MGTLASELRPIAQDLSAGPRVYADANLPTGVVAVMRRQLGWDVLHVVEHADLRRATDATHYAHALDLGRTLITLDHDFLDDRRFPPATSPGVVVCSAPDEPRLLRLVRYVDRQVFRVAREALPLRGRKLTVTADQATAGRHGRRRPGRSAS